jgi:hypothetical protein
MVESASHFAVYDAEMDRGYVYDTAIAMDAPQSHATWMDGFRLTYVSGGKTAVFDYDGANLQTLTQVNSAFKPFFNRDYRLLHTISPENALQSTPMLTPQDL